MKPLILLAIIVLLCGCTDSKETYRVLNINGYTDIGINGYSWFGCSKGDFYATKFVAKMNGRNVEGVVCSGLLFKASTIRF